MSYDLMVFEPSAAPKQREKFLSWYSEQVNWSAGNCHDDPGATSSQLAAWFFDMIKNFPAMNGPYRSDEVGNSRITGYSIGASMIYVDFRWSEAKAAYEEVRRCAAKHRLGFFDISGNSEIVFPPD